MKYWMKPGFAAVALPVMTACLFGAFFYGKIANGNSPVALPATAQQTFKDPGILFEEDFEAALPAVLDRYDDVLNGEGMSLDTDTPEGSRGNYSLRITGVGGKNSGGHLYKSFSPGFDSIVHIRYYVKYPLSSKGYIHHEAIWIGGYHPGLKYPNPRAGLCGIDGRLSIAYEPANDSLMGTYNYWTAMKSWNNGKSCFGNDLLFQSPVDHPLLFDEWMCIELRIKLNNPASSSNGELTIWQNGVEIGNWGRGFPKGHWVKDRWMHDPAYPGFEGLRWRAVPELNINYVWIEFFDDKSPGNVEHHIKYDDLVIARNYIGPLK
jgi:hypothetical protein